MDVTSGSGKLGMRAEGCAVVAPSPVLHVFEHPSRPCGFTKACLFHSIKTGSGDLRGQAKVVGIRYIWERTATEFGVYGL